MGTGLWFATLERSGRWVLLRVLEPTLPLFRRFDEIHILFLHPQVPGGATPTPHPLHRREGPPPSLIRTRAPTRETRGHWCFMSLVDPNHRPPNLFQGLQGQTDSVVSQTEPSTVPHPVPSPVSRTTVAGTETSTCFLENGRGRTSHRGTTPGRSHTLVHWTSSVRGASRPRWDSGEPEPPSPGGPYHRLNRNVPRCPDEKGDPGTWAPDRLGEVRTHSCRRGPRRGTDSSLALLTSD